MAILNDIVYDNEEQSCIHLSLAILLSFMQLLHTLFDMFCQTKAGISHVGLFML